MVQDLIPQYYFHCTTNAEIREQVKDNFPTIHMVPRISPSFGFANEPEIARICVCPTISGCLVAAYYYDNPIIVLRTCKLVHAWKPFEVFDSHITGEKWLITPADFKTVAVFSRDEVDFNDNSELWNLGDIQSEMIKIREALGNAEKFKSLQEFI